MVDFGIKDIIDILVVALMLFYFFKLMKKSGTLPVFIGVIAFIVAWIFASEIFNMRLTGTILDKFMGIGLIILVILFQDPIRRFLIELGSRGRWQGLSHLFRHEKKKADNELIMPVVYACMSLSKSKTGALIALQRKMPLKDFEKTGDIIDANINMRLIENIFFKNSPLHDGALIIADGRLMAAGCILPVSHDMNISKDLGLRHRAALGLSQVTDAICVIVSEETGHISIAADGILNVKVTTSELEHMLTAAIEEQ